MIRRPSISTRSVNLYPSTTIFRSHLGLVTLAQEPQFAEVDAVIGIERARPFERAMDIDRGLPARGAQFGDHPLRLAERIGADEDAAVGLGAHRGEKLGDLVPSGRMEATRQAAGSLGEDDWDRQRVVEVKGWVGRVD